MHFIEKAYRFLLPVVAIFCIVVPSVVVAYLPIILGLIMVITGIIDICLELSHNTNEMYEKRASSLILIVMGLCFLLGQDKAVLLMGITWGLLGIQNVNEEIVEILQNRHQKRPWKMQSVFTVLKFILSLALIFEPIEKFNFHIILLGLEILIVSIKGKDLVQYMEEVRLRFKKQ